jgi:hypothetical protein
LDKTTRSLVALLESPDPSLRLAAMRVVAALELRAPQVVRGLTASLDSDQEALQVQALRALAQLGPADAIHLVAPKILAGGAVRQHAAQVLTLAGSASVPVLRKLYPSADHHGRRAIASTLAAIGGGPAFGFVLAAIPPEDLETIKHLTGCLRQMLDGATPALRTAAAGQLRAFLRARATVQNPHAVIAGLILLGGMSDAKVVEEAQGLLFGYLDRRQPEAVRRNAAVSLSRLPVAAAKAPGLALRLLPHLCDPDWAPVPQNLLPLLQRLELPPATVLKLLPLLDRSPHVAVQGHVLERLRGHDKPALARQVLAFLSSPHPRLRDAAEAALKTMPSGAEAVFELWAAAPDADAGRRVDLVLRAYPDEVRKRLAGRAADRLVTLYEKGDARWQTLIEFVRATDAPALQKRVAKRLAALRGSSSPKRWDAMAALLRLLWDQNLTTPEQRYEYALLLLRQSRKDVGREARAADPSLRVLGGLARQDGAKLVGALVQERHLGAEEFYYLGFHLTEAQEELRPLGRALLQHLVERWPRHRLRRAAQHKMELQGRQGAASVEA